MVSHRSFVVKNKTIRIRQQYWDVKVKRGLGSVGHLEVLSSHQFMGGGRKGNLREGKFK